MKYNKHETFSLVNQVIHNKLRILKTSKCKKKVTAVNYNIVNVDSALQF